MREFSLAELSRHSGDVTSVANREPVTLTHHRKPRYVLMSIEDYKKLAASAAQTRRVFTVENTPEEVAEWLLPALDRFADGEDVTNG
ncbi:type II toxin-antitoxin system Phd/YefM family antitoxin [Labrys okinawensis]|uniref:type II toxin-antitoxin system Phd/YefM family antitoxin n=1 Tax=Labrys okinawensis TaxID=346911 RepID=UPI0039BD11B2